MASKINVPIGDWWKINHVNHTIGVNYEKFIERIKLQINRFDKVENKKKKYIVEDIKQVFDENVFEKMCFMSEKIKNKYPPIMTFHGTTNPSILNSILRTGYLLPGEIQEQHGHIIRIEHGNYHGDGIYTSTNLDMTQWYSMDDKEGKTLILVNLVFPGKVEDINPQPWKKSKPVIIHDLITGYTKVIENENNVRKYSSSGLIIPVDGLYEDEYHSRMLPDMSQIVSASGEYVFPLFVLQIRPRLDFTLHDSYWNTGFRKKENFFIS